MGVNAGGDQGMGFSHKKTTHHFHLLADGGAIEIQSNEPADAASQEAIRQAFGDDRGKVFPKATLPFRCLSTPRSPPGVENMKRLKSKITYEAENTEHGAQLRITTHEPEGLLLSTAFSASRSAIIRQETPSKYKSRTPSPARSDPPPRDREKAHVLLGWHE